MLSNQIIISQNAAQAWRGVVAIVCGVAATLAMTGESSADPCGMVPPIYNGPGTPITRIGEQLTFVFYKDGVESFVIRPGYEGKVDDFGMLIPFPTPPSLRKMPDDIFGHIAAAIDPPEVVVDLRPVVLFRAAAADAPAAAASDGLEVLKRDQVRVIREEAVGMYEVAVLEAGSADALRRWMAEHGYQYPVGMDKVCDEYVDQKWCFVAVKTKVGVKSGADPRPGQRVANTNLPSGATFDGHVQAMGFRFHTDQLVVPMRLSAFNEGKTDNIVYLLTDGPRRIRNIPEEFVVRQLAGTQLIKNVTEPLPLRVINGKFEDIPQHRLASLKVERDPEPANGNAKSMFASDLMAVASGQLSLAQEEEEKELLRISEQLGLRGPDVDQLNADALKESRDKTVAEALEQLKEMTLTVVDGSFPRDVLAQENLTFAEYAMPADRNSPAMYDAIQRGPAPKREGVLISGIFPGSSSPPGRLVLMPASLASGGTALLVSGALSFWLRRRRLAIAMFLLGALVVVSGTAMAESDADLKNLSLDQLVGRLENHVTSTDATAELVRRADSGKAEREKVVGKLMQIAGSTGPLAQRGWAIAALAEIAGQDIDESLLKIHASESEPMLVRTWAAAARVAMSRSAEALVEKAQLVTLFPALGRPIGMRLIEQTTKDDAHVSAETLLIASIRVPQLQQSLTPAILAAGPEELVGAMQSAQDQQVRRQAAAYLATLAANGGKDNQQVQTRVVAAVAFAPDAQDVPWRGGPLFIPGLNWDQSHARELVGNLIAWHLWCDLHSRSEEQRQIHNNLRSLQLARVAGYQSPGFREVDTATWLRTWRQVVGAEGIEKILKDQNAQNDPRFQTL